MLNHLPEGLFGTGSNNSPSLSRFRLESVLSSSSLCGPSNEAIDPDIVDTNGVDTGRVDGIVGSAVINGLDDSGESIKELEEIKAEGGRGVDINPLGRGDVIDGAQLMIDDGLGGVSAEEPCPPSRIL